MSNPLIGNNGTSTAWCLLVLSPHQKTMIQQKTSLVELSNTNLIVYFLQKCAPGFCIKSLIWLAVYKTQYLVFNRYPIVYLFNHILLLLQVIYVSYSPHTSNLYHSHILTSVSPVVRLLRRRNLIIVLWYAQHLQYICMSISEGHEKFITCIIQDVWASGPWLLPTELARITMEKWLMLFKISMRRWQEIKLKSWWCKQRAELVMFHLRVKMTMHRKKLSLCQPEITIPEYSWIVSQIWFRHKFAISDMYSSSKKGSQLKNSIVWLP